MDDEQFELRLAGDLGRDEGIATAVEHADEVIDDWSETAYHFILLFAATTAKFTCPQVRAAAEAAGFPVPPTAYAWGGPMQRAARAGRIRRCGYVQHGDKTMHTQGVALLGNNQTMTKPTYTHWSNHAYWSKHPAEFTQLALNMIATLISEGKLTIADLEDDTKAEIRAQIEAQGWRELSELRP